MHILNNDNENPKNWYGVDIVRSNFSFGLNDKHWINDFSDFFAGGLSIEIENMAYKLQINIDSVILYGNIGYDGGNLGIITNWTLISCIEQ